MMEKVKSPVVVYAESTPNPNSMKYVTNKLLVEGSLPYEFKSREEAKVSPLAMELFNFPFITGVFMSANFITILKNDSIHWNHVAMELREFIKNYLEEDKPVLTGKTATPQPGDDHQKAQEQSFHTRPQNEVEEKIVEILEEYVRPAVESDGGAIHFKSFEDGIVTVVLRGACSGCPSSTITLKSGIEGLLKRMVPEVKEVVAESL